MHSTRFEHEMVGVSRTLGRDHGLTIRFEGNQAKTDGGNVVFPALPTRDLTDREVMVMRGFADHEAAHKRHTDFKAGGAAMHKAKTERRPLFAAMIQAFEDARIEPLAVRDFPGSAKNLMATANAVAEAAVPTLKEMLAKPGADLRQFVSFASVWSARQKSGLGTPGEAAALECLPPAVRKLAATLADRAIASKSTKDTIALANEADVLLGSVTGDVSGIEEANRRLGGGAGKAPNEPGGEEGSQPGVGPDPTTNDDKFSKRGEPKGGEAGRGGGKGSGGGSSMEPQPVQDALSVEKFIEAMLGVSSVAERGIYPPHRVPTKEQDRLHVAGGTTNYSHRLAKWSEAGRTRADERLRANAGRNAVIARKLELLLLDNQRTLIENGKMEGRLDRRSLVRAGAFGHENVFSRRTDELRPAAAVCMLVDLSGSMSANSKMHVARDACLILAQALDRCGVPVEVRGFCNKGSTPLPCPPGQWGRTVPMDTFIFKGWNDDFRVAKGRIAHLPECVGGDNSDADAIHEATASLLSRRETNRVLITLSDGSPAWGNSVADLSPEPGEGYNHLKHRYEYYATREAVMAAEKAGIRTVGVGILDSSVTAFYPQHAVVHSTADLAGEALEQIAKALLNRKLKAAA